MPYDGDLEGSRLPGISPKPTHLDLGPYKQITASPEEAKQRVLKLVDYQGNYELWPNPVPKDASLETLSEQHQILNKYWMESPEFHSFKELFINVILKQERLMVSSGMCLGLGSLTADWHGKPHRSGTENRSLCQLIAFEACIELLRKYLAFESSTCILMPPGTKYAIGDIYFQDPVLNELDRAFLSSRGYVILNTPESESHVTENTFVFTPGAEWVVCLSPINTPSPPTL